MQSCMTTVEFCLPWYSHKLAWPTNDLFSPMPWLHRPIFRRVEFLPLQNFAHLGGKAEDPLTTLSKLINTVDPQTWKPLKKLSLDNHFVIAHAISLTVFNIHDSGWIYKNIWSWGILLFSKHDGVRVLVAKDTNPAHLYSQKKQSPSLSLQLGSCMIGASWAWSL